MIFLFLLSAFFKAAIWYLCPLMNYWYFCCLFILGNKKRARKSTSWSFLIHDFYVPIDYIRSI